MAVFDMSDVTRTLIWVLETGVPALPDWPGLVGVNVSPLPPDRLQTTNDLGFYLYHLTEDPHYKNLPGEEPAEKAMALNLYYQLTAAVGAEQDDAYRAQLLMGGAVRVLHDFPLITDTSELYDSAGVAHSILAQRNLNRRGNRIRTTLRPVPVDDSVDYWTAGEAPLRLAAYYQVSVILLDSAPAARAAPRVLSYASPVFATGAPLVSGSSALVELVVGRDTNRSRVRVEPAEVTLGERFELQGSGFAGEGIELRLRDHRGAHAVDASAWAVVAQASRVEATVAEGLGDTSLIPGNWNASVSVSKRVGSAPDALIRHASNDAPIRIVPRLDATSPVGPSLGSAAPGALLAMTGWLFEHADIPVAEDDPDAVQLYFDDRRLGRGANPGEFTITGASSLSVRLPLDVASNRLLLVRVAVRGAWSAPRWLEVA